MVKIKGMEEKFIFKGNRETGKKSKSKDVNRLFVQRVLRGNLV